MAYKVVPYPTLTAYAGNAININITVMQNNGLPFNLTGLTNISYCIAASAGASAIVTKTVAASGIVITDPTEGVFQVQLKEADTKTLAPGPFPTTYYQEALLIDSQNAPVTVYAGLLVLNPASLQV